MIVIALGANSTGRHGPPGATLQWAASRLGEGPLRLRALSGLWRSAPYGLRAQPSFLNAVAVLETELGARDLLAHLALLERRAGRLRGRRWGPRALDLDLIDHDGLVRRPAGMGRLGAGAAVHAWQARGIVLPHPDMAGRAFVLAPLAEVAPGWRHPVSGRTAAQMLACLDERQRAACRPLRGRPGGHHILPEGGRSD